MLILARKIGERVRIETPAGEVIWVSVVDISGSKIRLGFAAPPEVVIAREDWDGPAAKARTSR